MFASGTALGNSGLWCPLWARPSRDGPTGARWKRPDGVAYRCDRRGRGREGDCMRSPGPKTISQPLGARHTPDYAATSGLSELFPRVRCSRQAATR